MNFDWIIYKELNPDLKTAGLISKEQCENHFRVHCVRDKRNYNIYQVYPDFNPIIYKNIYPDLSHMCKLDLERHWIMYGRNESRVYTNTNNDNTKAKITFIIPTIGRYSIIKTIESLFRQTDNNWNCIIVCDGISLNSEIQNTINNDIRISVITIEKTGICNNAGTVRNRGIELVKTEWVGFVDDDDELSPLYVETFISNIYEDNLLKCIIFRMMYSDNGIFPYKNHTNFIKERVGISFCYSMELVKQGLKFVSDDLEDFKLLDEIRSKGHKILMSNKICYFVRPNKNINLQFVYALKTVENDIVKSIINK
jgi:hypothetical protein